MTKIDIISGFLGAGKTTFIKKLLKEAISGEKVVLIENEFGEIGIDGGFLQDAGIEIREMNSGCICCSLVGDFGKSLEEVRDLARTVVEEGILSGKIPYGEMAPSYIKEKHERLFLSPDAPEELKRIYYRKNDEDRYRENADINEKRN